MRLETVAVHGGDPPAPPTKAVAVPIAEPDQARAAA